jgi:uncharacterized membrane protein YfcA
MELVLFISVLFCSILSGALAIGGGQILLFLLSLIFPIPEAMLLHGATQLTGNVSRSAFFYKYLNWKSIKIYFFGSIIGGLLFWKISFVPEKHIIYIFLGSLPIISLFKRVGTYFKITKTKNAAIAGIGVSFSQLMFGVSGSLVDVFYTHSGFNRYQIIANKSFTQIIGHIFKILFYGSLLAKDNFSQLEPHWFPLMMLTALLGTYLGKKLVPIIKEVHFIIITRGLIASFSLVLLFKGVRLYAQL